jgi:tetratricopeptide (TPR) repeat protein
MPPKNRKPRSKAPKQLFADNSIVVEETSDSKPFRATTTSTIPVTSMFNVALNTPFQITGKNLCLNMIVKNESKIITRLLESVVKYIDCYCICDTGSTDNTVQVIQDFFNRQSPPIPGRIIQEPFKDFGYNRTFALKACEQIDTKYVLLLDADMIFQVNPSISREELYNRLTDDTYYIFQGSDTFYYKNVRIVKNRIGMSYWGVTHEYVNTPNGTKYGKFDKDDVFINDIGDGGCKTDKFVRDINLLKKGLEDEPNNDRYTFYLANSYRDAGQFENAIATYKKRIEIGGWFDEVWHSHYSIGKCYKHMGDMANAIYWWMEAYNFYPNRIENLYEIIHHYRCNGKNQLAYGFYLIADEERKKNTHSDYLFLQKDVYDYKLDYELSIIGYYCNYKDIDLKKVSLKVLNYPFVDEGISRNTLSNYKFYSDEIKHKNILSEQNRQILKSIGNSIPELQSKLGEFNTSTPSMCLNEDGDLVVNVRFVNYKINDNGGYENPGNISTINVIAVIGIEDEDWEIINEFILGYDTNYDNLYVGLEDIRLFKRDSAPSIYFNANRGLSYHNITIEHGTIDMDKQETVSGFINMPGQREVEKNWVLFEDSSEKMKIIYNWSPLVIGDITPSSNITVSTQALGPMTFDKTHSIETPQFFKHLRGSTNGVRVGDEIWFICHTVSYEDRRYYYHLFVALDATTYQVKRHTPYFTFQKEKVEYTLGFVYFEPTQEIMLGYSLMDREAEYIMVDKSVIEDMMM